MWEVMLSQTHTLEKVLRELLSKLQDQQLRRVFGSSTEDACIHHLAVSDQTGPCSLSGLCLPLQENRHGPLPSHLPQHGHLLQDVRTQPLRASRDLPSTRFPCASRAGPLHTAWAPGAQARSPGGPCLPGQHSASPPARVHPSALLCRLETWGRARARSGAETRPLHRLSGLQGWGRETLVTTRVSCLLCASSCCSIAPQRHESKRLPTLSGQEELAQTTLWCAVGCRALGCQAAVHGQSCPQDRLSGSGALALSCQWEPGAARCWEPCRLCQALTAIFVAAAGLQRH